jgi:hypothetical protein
VAAGHGAPSPGLRREERVAALIVDRFDLSPPVDLGRLEEVFADVEADAIPGSCDGLVLGLHGPRPRPLILLKRGRPRRRQRFTLAHEFGHVLLPWHVGSSYLCDTGRGFDEEDFHAAADETQANRFAAHLLVPSRWLDQLRAEHGDDHVAPLMAAIDHAEVSAHVACIRLGAALPPGRVFAVLDDDQRVVLSGQTAATRIDPPEEGEPLNSRRLSRFATEIEEIRFASRRVMWWTFGTEGDGEGGSVDPRSAREVLDALLDRHLTPANAQHVRQSLGGVIGAENSVAKREGVVDRGDLYARFRARFAKARDYPESLLEDPDFDIWVQKRADDLSE